MASICFVPWLPEAWILIPYSPHIHRDSWVCGSWTFSLCLLGIDACIYRDMLKWNKSSFLQKLVAAWMRILLTFLISNVSWVLANVTSESSHCFRKGNRNSACRLCIMVCPSFWEDYYLLIYTHYWELMNSVGSHGSSSLPFVMKVMVCHFVSDSHEVMTALIVMLPSIVVVEISLQLHRSHLLQWYIFMVLLIVYEWWTDKDWHTIMEIYTRLMQWMFKVLYFFDRSLLNCSLG